MITRQGTHKCEHCGKEYDWIARKFEKGEIVVRAIDEIRCHNVQFFGFCGDHLIATGCCPHCGMMQIMPLLDEKIEQTGAN